MTFVQCDDTTVEAMETEAAETTVAPREKVTNMSDQNICDTFVTFKKMEFN